MNEISPDPFTPVYLLLCRYENSVPYPRRRDQFTHEKSFIIEDTHPRYEVAQEDRGYVRTLRQREGSRHIPNPLEVSRPTLYRTKVFMVVG